MLLPPFLICVQHALTFCLGFIDFSPAIEGIYLGNSPMGANHKQLNCYCMNWKKSVNLALFFLFLLVSGGLKAQKHSPWNKIGQEGVISADTIKKEGYTLVFINKDSTFNPKVKKNMIDAFFEVYPKEAAIYNKKTLKKVIIFIDPAYNGVAATGGELIRVNPDWMHKHPEDIDVVTHEAMHIVQSYPQYEPIWVTEGIADYVRATLGINNVVGGWTLPDYKPSQKYDNSYRITARFFIWLEKYKKQGIIQSLDDAMRTKKYTEDFWKKETSSTVDQLWEEYGNDPII